MQPLRQRLAGHDIMTTHSHGSMLAISAASCHSMMLSS